MKEVLLNREEIKYNTKTITKNNIKRLKFKANKISFTINFKLEGTVHHVQNLIVTINNTIFKYDINDDILQDYYINDNGYFIHDDNKEEIILLINPEFSDEINLDSFLFKSHGNFKFRILRG